MKQNTPYFLIEYSKKEYSICCKLPDGTTSNVCGHANKETAEFIVCACNAHHNMVNALELIRDKTCCNRNDQIFKIAENALKLAEKF